MAIGIAIGIDIRGLQQRSEVQSGVSLSATRTRKAILLYTARIYFSAGEGVTDVADPAKEILDRASGLPEKNLLSGRPYFNGFG